MRFARWVFLIAGIYGVLVIAPQYFTETKVGRDYPPAVTHPEFYYGFVGVCLAWQVLFLIVATNPIRLRPVMPAAILEKLGFGIAVPLLYSHHRIPGVLCVFGLVDLTFAALFGIAFFTTAPLVAQADQIR